MTRNLPRRAATTMLNLNVSFVLLCLLSSVKSLHTDVPPPYHSTNALLHALRRLAHTCPHLHAEWAQAHSLPFTLRRRRSSSTQTRSMLILTLTHNARRRYLHRHKGHIVPSRPSAVFVFGEHGRERITSELAFHLLREACSSPPRDFEAIVIPIANTPGRHVVETGQSCWRLNSHGVDLNRNYLQFWGVIDNGTVPSEEHAGPAPLSETETRIVDAVVHHVNPVVYISVHSGGRAVLLPWDAGGGINDACLHAAKTVATHHCRGCPVGTANSIFGYRAYGTGVDHMVAVRNVPVALTLEIFGGPDNIGCERMFNPMDIISFEDVLRNWSGLLHTVGDVVVHKELEQRANSSEDAQPGTWNTVRKFYDSMRRGGYWVSFVEDHVDALSHAVHEMSMHVQRAPGGRRIARQTTAIGIGGGLGLASKCTFLIFLIACGSWLHRTYGIARQSRCNTKTGRRRNTSKSKRHFALPFFSSASSNRRG